MTDKLGVPADFIQHVKNCVREMQLDYPHANAVDAFAHWAGGLVLTDLDSDDIFDLVVGTSGKSNKGLDIAYRDEKNGIHYLFQAKYPNEPRFLGSEVVRELLDAYTLLAGDIEGLDIEHLAKISSDLKDSIAHNYEIRLGFLIFGSLSDEAKNELQSLVAAIANATVVVYDLQELYELDIAISGVRSETDDISLTLPLFPPAEDLLKPSSLFPYSIVANVDLVQYARLVRPYIPRIFDANVRNPLKNKINSDMAETITDPQKRQYFWHYNNGLTILVRDIDETRSGLLTLTAPTIVNGCQTTATLSTAIEKLGTNADDIHLPLLVRFIKIAADDSTLRINIARYTNAQTPVVTPDFKSNEEEQEKIAYSFKMLRPPVFYERKRGQWNMLTPSEKREFSGSIKCVKMVDIGQRWYAFMFSPAKSIVGKGDLFKDEGAYRIIFTPPHSAREYFIAYLLFSQFDNFLKERKRNAEEKSDKQTAIFLRLARARNLAAAHMTNLVGKLIIRKYGVFDYEIANKIYDAVEEQKLFEAVVQHLMTVFRQYDQRLNSTLTWLNALKDESAIANLEELLFQHIELYASSVNINLLDHI